MNSLHRFCQSIDKKIDILIQKVDYLDNKVNTLEQILSSNSGQSNEIKELNHSTEKKNHKHKVISLTSKVKIEKSGNIHVKEYNDCILIIGDTFNKKNIIKKYKGLWNPDNKGWVIKNKGHKEKVIKTLKRVSKTCIITSIDNSLIDNEKKNEDESNKEIPKGFAFVNDD